MKTKSKDRLRDTPFFKGNRRLTIFKFVGIIILLINPKSFINAQNSNEKFVGKFIYDLSLTIGYRGGCENTADALTLMQAYQIIFREHSGIPNKEDKVSDIKRLLSEYDCLPEAKFPVDPKIPGYSFGGGGGINISSEIEPYIFALEMMTPKQKSEFKKHLPQVLVENYEAWNEKNTELKKQIDNYLLEKEVIPMDIDENMPEVFEDAIKENPNPKLKEYKLNKNELNELLNNQDFKNELQRQLNKEK